MHLKQINTLPELLEFIPKLLDLHEKLDGRWESDLSKDDFGISLIQSFTERAGYYGDFSESGEIIYFVTVLESSPTDLFCWLFYMNPAFRDKTKLVIAQLKELYTKRGFRRVRMSTTRLSSSYERWLEKQGARKHEIIYQLELHNGL